MYVGHEYQRIKVRKVAMIRNGYHHVPYLTRDTTWERDENTINHDREPRGQSFHSS